VSNEQDVEESVKKTIQILGSIEMLVCFVGIGCASSATEMSLETWQKVMNVNLTGGFLCSKHVGR